MMLEYMESPSLTMLLTALVPTFAFSMLNLRHFNVTQILNALAVAGVAGGILFFLVQAAGSLVGFTLPPLAWCLLGLLNFYFWGERFFSETLPESKRTRLSILTGMVLTMAVASHFISLAVFNAVLLVVTLAGIFDGLRECKRPKEGALRRVDGKTIYQQTIHRGVKLTHKPNIYLLFLESYHSKKGMQRLYKIDDTKTDELFKKHGFTLYDNVFCNVPCTLPSLSTLLTGNFLSKPEQGNIVLDTLRENGYQAEFFDSGAYIFGQLAKKDEYTTYEYPPKVVLLYSLLGPLFAQSHFLRKFVGGIDLFDTGGNFSKMYASLSKRLQLNIDAPRIFCTRFGAVHKDGSIPVWEPDGSAFAITYRQAVARAQQELRKVVELITDHDPDSLIIALGDHGGMRHFHIWNGKETAEEAIKSRNVSLDEVALDIFDVRLAIRWPVPHKTSGAVMSPINLFRYVFEALGGGSDLLLDLAPNISTVGEQLVFVQDGKPLEQILPFSSFGSINGPCKRIVEKTASTEDYLTLGQYFQYRDPTKAIKILKDGHRHYPHNPDICMELGKLLGARGDKTGLVYLDISMKQGQPSIILLVEYLEYLWKFGKFSKGIEIFKTYSELENLCSASKAMIKIYYASGMYAEAEICALKVVQSAKLPVLAFWIPFIESALYFLERGEYQKCIEACATGLAAPKRMHNYLKLVFVLKGLAHINIGEYQEAKKIFEYVCQNYDDPGAWSLIMLARMQEIIENAAKSVHTLFTAAKSYEKYSDSLLYHACMIMQRNKINNPDMIHLRIICLKTHKIYCSILEKENIFTSKNNQMLRDYLYNGMLTGSSPLRWFNPQVYSILNESVWNLGIDPLIHFVDNYTREFSLRHHVSHFYRHKTKTALKFNEFLKYMEEF